MSDITVVTGATGHVGRAIVEDLLARGKAVRAVARSAQRLENLAAKGADPAAVDVSNGAALTDILRDAAAAFLMIPPDLAAPDVRASQNRISLSYAQAVLHSRLRHAVVLSSMGAHLSDGGGPINGLYDNEQRLNKILETSILYLRPAFFMENLLAYIPAIRTLGFAAGPFRADLPLPMIATVDIGRAAAQRLTRLDFSGKSAQELLGPRDLTFSEAFAILGRAIGKPDLEYRQVPYNVAEKALGQAGLSADYARLMIQMARSTNQGVLRPIEKRSPRNTTSTSIEDFAPTFAAAFNASEPAPAGSRRG